MSYERLYDLKFKKHLPTYVLEKKFPKEKRKVSQLALLDLPFAELRELVSRDELHRLSTLKQWILSQTEKMKREEKEVLA